LLLTKEHNRIILKTFWRSSMSYSDASVDR